MCSDWRLLHREAKNWLTRSRASHVTDLEAYVTSNGELLNFHINEWGEANGLYLLGVEWGWELGWLQENYRNKQWSLTDLSIFPKGLYLTVASVFSQCFFLFTTYLWQDIFLSFQASSLSMLISSWCKFRFLTLNSSISHVPSSMLEIPYFVEASSPFSIHG